MIRRSSILIALGAALAIAAGGTASAQGTGEPPNWCGNQGSKNAAERTICATQSLWYLDDTLNLSYAFAYDRLNAEQKRILQASQVSWLHGTRNACGGNADCLARVMQSRMDTLDDINTRGRL
jgi:uncharacterized protein